MDGVKAMRGAWLLVLTLLWAEPASACSLIWPGYERTSRESEIVALVEVESASPGEKRSGAGESLYGVATATVLSGLKGVSTGAPLSFEHRLTDVDYVCDYDVLVESGKRYWVWLDRTVTGDRTRFAVLDESLNTQERWAIRAGARSR